MEQKNSENLIQKRQGIFTVTVNTSTVSFMILCAYLASIFLCYINENWVNLVSLLLYGFVLLMILSIVSAGRMSYDIHMLWYGIFTLVCAFSCTYAFEVNTASEKTVDVAKLLLFSVMFINAVNTPKRLRNSMLVIMISSLLLFVNLVATDRLVVDERLGTTLTGNANSFATIFMIGAICSVYFVFFSQKRTFKIISLIILLLQLYALALSGSRKFFLLPVVLLGALKIFSTDKDGRKHLIRNTLIGMTVILGVWWALFNVKFLYDAIGYRMEGMVAAFTGKGEVDASSQARLEMIDIAVRLWKEKPLFGHGLNNYKHLNNLYMDAYAHNNYAELLASLGLVGLIAYYWYYVYLVVKLARKKNMGVKRWYWALSIICLAVFDYGAVSYDGYIVQIILMLAKVSLKLEKEESDVNEEFFDEQHSNVIEHASQ